MLGVILRWTSIPSTQGGRGGGEILLQASRHKTVEISVDLTSHLA